MSSSGTDDLEVLLRRVLREEGGLSLATPADQVAQRVAGAAFRHTWPSGEVLAGANVFPQGRDAAQWLPAPSARQPFDASELPDNTESEAAGVHHWMLAPRSRASTFSLPPKKISSRDPAATERHHRANLKNQPPLTCCFPK